MTTSEQLPPSHPDRLRAETIAKVRAWVKRRDEERRQPKKRKRRDA